MKRKKEQKEKPRNQISTMQMALLISVALIFDTVVFVVGFLNFIPFVGMAMSLPLLFIVNTFANLTFLTWFFILGVGLFKPSRLMAIWATYFLSFIPFLNLFPVWVVAVILMILSARVKNYSVNVRA